jgi:hypothetical protein
MMRSVAPISLLFLSGMSVCADIPWKEANVRLKQENARLAKQGPTNKCFVICTLYYTPKESGFTAARGFDARMETRPGLKGRKYPRDFLFAVKKEGIGRISRPVDGHYYIGYKSGRTYRYADQPVGRAHDPLIARTSAAVRRGQKRLPNGHQLVLADRTLQKTFRSKHFQIIDTGGGLRRWQVDLYWGEDDPLGPGKLMARPRGTMFEYAYSEAQVER